MVWAFKTCFCKIDPNFAITNFMLGRPLFAILGYNAILRLKWEALFFKQVSKNSKIEV